MDKNKSGEIDLKDVEWLKLSPEEFNQVEMKLQEQAREMNKIARKNKVRNVGTEVVKIDDKRYELPKHLVTRFRKLTSEKSKENLLEEIKQTYKPIPSL